VKAFLAAALIAPSVHPWPVGAGPGYRPPARTATVIAGKPVGDLRCGAAGPSFRIHLELFANRKVVIVPAGIGVAEPSQRTGASVEPGGCVYPMRTVGPDGVVQVSSGSQLHLADLFRLWGQPLGAHRLASFSSRSPVRAYVGGRLVRGPAGAIPLTSHAQIVLELGGYVPPHPSFLFAGGTQ
jgi:hypothetical protein